jgi:hypothetical protein
LNIQYATDTQPAMWWVRVILSGVCARQSWHQPAGESPARGNRVNVGAASAATVRTPSRYRVLRAAPSRGGPRSVDRECAGRNASSVKVSSPEKQNLPWWPSKYAAAKAVSASISGAGTTGVQGHSMYTRLMSEPGRSPSGGAQRKSQRHLARGQGTVAKSWVSTDGEVRSRRSSGEVG